eukprot:3903965-Prymnesium_polylepis.1
MPTVALPQSPRRTNRAMGPGVAARSTPVPLRSYAAPPWSRRRIRSRGAPFLRPRWNRGRRGERTTRTRPDGADRTVHRRRHPRHHERRPPDR